MEPSDCQPERPEIDWPEVLALANKTKTTRLVLAGFARCGLTPPADIAATLDRQGEQLLARNLANLASIARISELFHANGIRAVTYKGVIRAHGVYGKWDIRLAQDLDLLVSPADYPKSIELLQKNGYHPGVSAKSKWWHHYLGESPFIPEDPGSPVVDLHHRLQQPGGPAPRKLADFLRESIVFRLSEREILTLSPFHALLVTAISYGKARRNRETWLIYAHELAMALQRLSDDERRELLGVARSQGLERILLEAVGNAGALFGIDPGIGRQSAPRTELLASATCTTEQAGFKSPHRSVLLWQWTDGGPMRPLRFTRGLLWVKASEARQRYERLAD